MKARCRIGVVWETTATCHRNRASWAPGLPRWLQSPGQKVSEPLTMGGTKSPLDLLVCFGRNKWANHRSCWDLHGYYHGDLGTVGTTAGILVTRTFRTDCSTLHLHLLQAFLVALVWDARASSQDYRSACTWESQGWCYQLMLPQTEWEPTKAGYYW